MSQAIKEKDTFVDKHILFVVNVDWFFASHRLPIARALKRRGARVTVVCANTGVADKFTEEGLDFIPMPFTRSGMRPLEELRIVFQLISLYRRLQPDIIHHVSIKPILYGGLASYFARGSGVVNALSGLGFVFTQVEPPGALRKIAMGGYRVAFGRPRTKVIVQNPDDRAFILENSLAEQANVVMIRGSGVDCNLYHPADSPTSEPPTVILASRMLWDKGIAEYVDAAKILRKKGISGRFVLVGGIDTGNPSCIPKKQIEEWTNAGTVEWWGHHDAMHEILVQSSIVVLPSYREGLPKVLIEAAACGKPLVATDVPGCREVVRHGENGLLVPPRDPGALAEALGRLLQADSETLQLMGARSRKMAEQHFSEDIVVEQTLDVYRALLGA